MTTSESRRWGGVSLWVPVVLVTAVVLATVLVLALRGTDFDPATPEGHVQEYVRAVIARDYEAAVSFIDPAVGCSEEDYRWAWVPASFSVTHEATRLDGEQARVDIRITEQQGPFSDSWHRRETISLDRTEGGWVISRVPWPLYHCEGETEA